MKMSGQVPKELGNLGNLRQLHLENNRLTGTGGTTQAQACFVWEVHVFIVRECSIVTHGRYSHALGKVAGKTSCHIWAGSPQHLLVLEPLGRSALTYCRGVNGLLS